MSVYPDHRKIVDEAIQDIRHAQVRLDNVFLDGLDQRIKAILVRLNEVQRIYAEYINELD